MKKILAVLIFPAMLFQLAAAPAPAAPAARRPGIPDPVPGIPVVSSRTAPVSLECESGKPGAGAKVVDDAQASGGKAVSLPGDPNAKTAKEPMLTIQFQNLRYDKVAVDIMLKSSGPARIWYEFEDNLRYPIDIYEPGKWEKRQLYCNSFRPGVHTVKLYSTAPVLADVVTVGSYDTDTLPEGNSLRCLPPAKSKDRITILPRHFFPEKAGDAVLTLWKNDAIGAATFTVDDNHAQDHDWWIETAKKYGIRVTWFAIVYRIGTGHPAVGSWANFQKLLDSGHDVQSHSYTHLHDLGISIDEEYSKSIDVLEKNLKNHKILAVAYPGGKYTRKNSVAAMSRYFIGARGTGGQCNEAGKIDYSATNSFAMLSMDPANRIALPHMVKLDPKFKRCYRSWYCHHFHNLPNEDYKKPIVEAMKFYSENKVWTPGFVDVLKYGQERDTAKLETVKNTASEIELELTDKMDDSIFDAPLTIRLRVPDDWTGATATQNNAGLPVVMDEKDGKKVAMFDAVPDRGVITVKRK